MTNRNVTKRKPKTEQRERKERTGKTCTCQVKEFFWKSGEWDRENLAL